jgi:hypothetical protein
LKRSPQIQSRVNDIAKDLANGKERAEILRKYAKKWQISPRSIDRYLNPAKVIAKSMANLKDSVVKTAIIDETEKAIRAGLKSDLELELILSQIASGNVQITEWIKGEAVLRNVTPTEIVNAAKTIFTKRGSNAPTKIAQTDKDGNDIKVTLNLS